MKAGVETAGEDENGGETVQITEEYLLSKTGQKQVSNIRSLDLSGLSVEELPNELFQKLSSLESLNLAKNQLQALPSILSLPKLQKLDVTENQLTSVDFLEHLPQLKELHIEGNKLDPSDKYIASVMCPNIKHIDKTPSASLKIHVNNFRAKLKPEVESIWAEHFADKSRQKQKLPENMKNSFIRDLVAKTKDRKLYGSSSLVKFRDFLLLQLSKELLDQVQSDSFEPIKKKPKLSETPGPDPGDPAKKEKKKSSKRELAKCLHPLPDYDPVHFMRCHFGDRIASKQGHTRQDPTDDVTKVWACEFEPDPHDKNKTKGVIATCGGDTLCFIDCSSGKVMRRYQQAKEQFYCLAWTTLEISGKPTNIVAAGGNNGHIKLLHPDHLVCYKQLGTGRPNRATQQYYVSCLLFHPDKPTVLFSGASDTTITMYDIGSPEGPSYDCECKALCILHATEGSGILNIVYDVKSDYLISGCEASCFAWKMGEDKTKHREPSLELILPGGKEAEVDGLAILAEDIVASKCAGESTFYLWRLSSHLNKNKTAVKVEPLLKVEWCESEVEYITLGSRGGILACGDDRGNIWLYNLKEWLKDPKSLDAANVHRPSRILPWPYCHLGKGMQSQKMTDVLNPPEEIVVNCVTMSSSCGYIVTGTDNNLVCIWRQEQEQDK